MQPHDRLFRAVFSQPRHITELLRDLLPAELVTALDWATLRVEHNDRAGGLMGAIRHDFVIRIELVGQTSFVYVLLEHQSGPHPMMPYRFHLYRTGIWQEFLKTHRGRKSVPAVIPVVVHHGARGPWRKRTKLSELLALPTRLRTCVAPFGLEAELILDDLSAQSEAELLGRSLGPTVTLTLWMLANVRIAKDLPARLRSVADLVAKVAREPGGLETLQELVQYIFEVTKLDSKLVIEAMTMKAGKRVSKKLLSTADILREEGRQQGLEQGLEQGREQGLEQGLEQGRQQGLQQAVALLLAERFGKLPAAASRRVRQAQVPELELWARQVLTADSLEQVFAASEPPPRSRRTVRPATHAARQRRARFAQ